MAEGRKPLTVALLRAGLPSYFPDRHGVWSRAEAALASLCAGEGAQLVVLPGIPVDARQTTTALDHATREGADFILCLHGGFTMGDVARTIAASPFRAGFWAVPEPVQDGDIQLNGFVSLNMSLSIARSVRNLRARPVQWYHGDPDSPALQQRLRTTLRALTAARALEGARIGVVGGLAMTFYNMEVSTSALRRRLGVEVASHDIHELTARMTAQPADRVAAELAAMAGAARVDGVSRAQMDLTARAVLGLRDMAQAGGYDALAVSDWPALQADPGMHPGAAFSWLETADNLPVASEGDVLGAVTQLVARALNRQGDGQGRTGALLDMTEPDHATGQLLMWHGGGGPLHLADMAGARWINHPMIGRGTPQGACFGAIADFVFAPGPASVFRIARDGGALFAMTAQIVARTPTGFAGCRGWLEGFRIGADPAGLGDVVATVMAHGIEHHFVLIPGDHAPALAEFGAWTGMTPLGMRPDRGHLDATDFT